MTDMEMTRLCASAMGIDTQESGHELWLAGHVADRLYDPIHDDAQAMALVKRFGLTCDPAEDVAPFTWRVCVADGGDWDNQIISEALDLNRAIVECVAKMQVLLTAPA